MNSFSERILRKLVNDRPIQSFWSKLVPNKYQYPAGTLREIDYRGIKLSIDLSDYIGHYLYFGFKDRGQDALLELASKSSFVLDIGSNIGSTALLLAKKVGKEGKVLGFEPDKLNYTNCQKNISINSFDNIEVLNIGLGDENSFKKLVVDTDSNRGGNRISNSSDIQGELVKIQKLDDLQKVSDWNKIDLVKIDVEGFELKVLKGAQSLFRKHKPKLFIELDDKNLEAVGDSADQLIDFLKNKLNYKLVIEAVSGEDIREDYEFRDCHFDILAKP